MMINATEMAKIFGRKVEAFMRNEKTIQFVNEALKSENSRFLDVFSQSDLYYSVPKAGTWMHRRLALKFAAWQSPFSSQITCIRLKIILHLQCSLQYHKASGSLPT